MEQTILLALKAKQKKDYRRISNELSEDALQTENKLQEDIQDWYTRVTDEIIDALDFSELAEHGTALAQQTITQIITDNTEDYKVIIGEHVINMFMTTTEKVERQLIIQENTQIIDGLLAYSPDNEELLQDNTPAPVTTTKSLTNIDVSYKKRIINTVQTILDKFIPNWNQTPGTVAHATRQTALENFMPGTNNISITERTQAFLTDFMQSITNGVSNTLKTPSLLFERIPNQRVLNFLENRVFVATPKTLEKVSDNIYKIISHNAEILGEHPYEIAKELRRQFTALTQTESKKIARTEVLRSKNEANWQRLTDNETVEMVIWKIGVEDDNSREEHVAQDNMITYIGNVFPNGQRYPYDENSEPGDYINCRCTLEAYYPDMRMQPPEGADCWFEEDMVFNPNVDLNLFDVVFVD